MGLDVSNIDMTADDREILDRLFAQGQEQKKWAPIVSAEMRQLESELRHLNLW